MGAKVLTTSATRTHTIMDAYWKHHTNNDRRRLEGLGLSAREMGGELKAEFGMRPPARRDHRGLRPGGKAEM